MPSVKFLTNTLKVLYFVFSDISLRLVLEFSSAQCRLHVVHSLYIYHPRSVVGFFAAVCLSVCLTKTFEVLELLLCSCVFQNYILSSYNKVMVKRAKTARTQGG